MNNSKADAIRWLRQAENDLAAAQLMLRERFFAQACFMSHQVSDKALKALAYYRGDRYVAGHSLVELVFSLETSYPQLSEFHELVGVLDQYYIPTRYPDALPGSAPYEVYHKAQAKAAVESAAWVVGFTQQLIA